MRFIDEMPAAAVRVPTFNLAFLPRFAAMSEEEFLAFAESKPLRKEFMLSMGRKGFPQKEMDAAMQRLRRTYERMDAEIAKSGGRGCSARTSRSRTSRSCRRSCAWPISVRRRPGGTFLASRTGTTPFARTRRSSRPIISARSSLSDSRI